VVFTILLLAEKGTLTLNFELDLVRVEVNLHATSNFVQTSSGRTDIHPTHNYPVDLYGH